MLAVGYDHLGDETSLSATVAGTADFLNNYTYDADGDLTQVTQQGQTGGNTVAPKLVNFAYNADGLYTTISRYANLAATQLVATSTYGYDADGNITSLAHTKGSTSLNSYTWTYDHVGRVTADSSSDGTDTYSYDASGQETAATHSYATNENYSYDANGNRSNTGYTTGTNNEVTSDGTYDYSYDNEGNLIQKTDIATGAYTTYTWDYHNRLTDVQNYTSGGTLTFHEHYVYDVYDQLIGTEIDPTGGGTYTSSQWFVYDAGGIAGANSSPPSQGGAGGVGSNVILVFNGSGTLTDRLLVVSPSGGSSASMFLADENASNVASWALPDNEGSIRDVVQYNSTTDTTSDVDHLVYDSVGNITSQTNSAYQPLFAYAGMLIDAGSGFRYDHARWYNPQLGKFISQDPSSFAGGDANLYRYVNNSPANFTDPTGMIREADGGIAVPAGDPGGAAAPGGGIVDTVGSMAAGAINAGAAMAGVNPAAMAQAMQAQMNAAMAAAQASMRATMQAMAEKTQAMMQQTQAMQEKMAAQMQATMAAMADPRQMALLTLQAQNMALDAAARALAAMEEHMKMMIAASESVRASVMSMGLGMKGILQMWAGDPAYMATMAAAYNMGPLGQTTGWFHDATRFCLDLAASAMKMAVRMMMMEMLSQMAGMCGWETSFVAGTPVLVDGPAVGADLRRRTHGRRRGWRRRGVACRGRSRAGWLVRLGRAACRRQATAEAKAPADRDQQRRF